MIAERISHELLQQYNNLPERNWLSYGKFQIEVEKLNVNVYVTMMRIKNSCGTFSNETKVFINLPADKQARKIVRDKFNLNSWNSDQSLFDAIDIRYVKESAKYLRLMKGAS